MGTRRWLSGRSPQLELLRQRGLHVVCGGGEHLHLTIASAARRQHSQRQTTSSSCACDGPGGEGNAPDAPATSCNVREDQAFVPRDKGREADGGGRSAGAPWRRGERWSASATKGMAAEGKETGVVVYRRCGLRWATRIGLLYDFGGLLLGLQWTAFRLY
jgi:hypothetical protein